MTRAYRRLRRGGWHATLLEHVRRQPSDWLQQALANIRDEALKRDIAMYSDGKTRQPVPIHPLPWLLTPTQSRYIQLLGIRIRRVLNRLLRTYQDDPALQAVLPLTDDERAWFAQLAPKGFPEPIPLFERLDTNFAIDDPQWVSSLRFLEFNSVGVGCLHFTPASHELIAEHIMPALQPALGESTSQLTDDPRLLLRRMAEAHAKAIGRSTPTVAFMERRESCAGGADEMRRVAEFLKAQGLPTVYGDPRELELRNGEVMFKDTIVDVVYRDFSLAEIISIEKHGGQVDAMKRAFSRNQVISALPGEFDHKSLFELLSNPEFGKYFTPSQRRTFHDYIPWTRLVRPRNTTDPDGREVDLPEHLRSKRERLVLKPNRSYGGENVTIGVDVTASVWDDAVAAALAKPDTYVAQELVSLPRMDFLSNGHGASGQELSKEFVTLGFIATPDGIAFIGRSFSGRIVNITRGGSLVPIFLVR